MKTCSAYCLVPSNTDLKLVIGQLFIFDNITVFNDGVKEHHISSSQDAAYAFHQIMKNGDRIRFNASKISNTDGGWLYRLEDGAAVIGLSGCINAAGTYYTKILKQYIPEGSFLYGDGHPGSTCYEFMHNGGAGAS